ncbi:MAG: CRTAC1 family protein [Reichenbachiella sp.]|uniref:CRTAC1 family protein n=1 Tax=Reichenbachiella sp. TaxID=2184521 RepID=UPI0032647281
MRFIILIVALLCVASCGPSDPRTQSTIKMAEELGEHAKAARSNNNYPYFTSHLLRKLELGIQGMPHTMRHGSWLDYVLVLLLKGDNAKCIEVIDAFLAGNQYLEVNESSVSFYKVKALANLRMGEIQNCIENHSGQSCIMPIQGRGIHQMKAPVISAIELYEELLAFDSQDLQSRWFLNLCYQAIGAYPNQVPPEYLIPPEVFDSDVEFPAFPNISMETGVAVNNHAGGASVEDFNNDGLLDIFTTSYSLGEPSNLFINNGQGTFDNKTQEYGLEGMVGGLNNIHADFNNDGLTDLYIMRGAWLSVNGQIPNSLLINTGKKFTDETRKANLYSKAPTGSVATADFNLDGHLDLFVGNESSGRHAAFPCQLFLNNGDGSFKDIASSVGLEINQFVKGASWGDINNDRLPDLYISVYHGQNLLFVNRGGENPESWKFEEIASKAGVSDPVMSFPSWFWDYNQDGWQDIMVIGYDNQEAYRIADEVTKDYLGQDFQGETPRLYRNNGDETFTDVTDEAGLDRLLYAMGANFGDLNNDGYPDFYLGTGEFNIWATVPNRAFLNIAGEKFVDVTTAGEFGQIQKGHGVAFGDLDNDGDQDIYHQVGGAAESDVFQNMLFHNPGFDSHWLTLKLEGTSANRSAIGARVEVLLTLSTTEKRTVYHTIGSGGSFGANTLRAEIGLGTAYQIDQVTILWPDQLKSTQTIENIQMDHFYTIRQGEDPVQLTVETINLKTEANHEHHH